MDQHLAATDSAEFTAVESAETAHTEQDVVGGITLSGRNRACARARVLAGMVLTSGIVITLSSLDTSVSAPN
ncbi:hypothetical protein G3I30_21000 [Actinospica acidiphila]|uniref:Uncharacterized protein n=1 Tax=Streptomyces griseoincarnatus TaxID=29305 RepID=A0ABT0VVM7_STRGI|nr:MULTISPECIES: hypothetical protein [Streptomyces]AXI84689.1 hypothetical protein SAM9427_00895 [Streptomyces sp. ETH9427]NEA81491.1 hypothetical protein [Actinospica acidiphila]MBQ0976075.1 hypothetical protein [Streptomyces sp. RK31]MCM2515403.1 hypothetical protein [Streptomyces griseoincarnatus]MUT93165.1 hypothetical protein [Streptomyces sp. Z38]